MLRGDLGLKINHPLVKSGTCSPEAGILQLNSPLVLLEPYDMLLQHLELSLHCISSTGSSIGFLLEARFLCLTPLSSLKEIIRVSSQFMSIIPSGHDQRFTKSLTTQIQCFNHLSQLLLVYLPQPIKENCHLQIKINNVSDKFIQPIKHKALTFFHLSHVTVRKIKEVIPILVSFQ